VDVRYTCDGLNVSPALSWSAGPAGTGSYAVVLSDIDAPDYHHWVVANISPGVVSLDEAFADPTVVLGRNSAGKDGYTGPCPPKGERHTYDVAVYALDQMLEAGQGFAAGGDGEQFVRLQDGLERVVGEAEVSAVHQRGLRSSRSWRRARPLGRGVSGGEAGSRFWVGRWRRTKQLA